MKKTLLSANRTLFAALFIFGTQVFGAYAQSTLYGVTNANAIFSIPNVSSPSVISGPYNITGVASGQIIDGIGFRPGNGMLYALGYDSLTGTGELYTLTSAGTTYTATPVSGTLASMALGLTNNIAFHFVPTMDDEIRIIGRNGNNYIMNANTGTITSTGISGISFALGDLHLGTGILGATAYTNNFYGSDITSEVGYDVANNVLVTFDSSNFTNGFNITSDVIHSVGATIGTTFIIGGSIGMDTWFDTLAHNNTIYLAGSPLLSGAHLYSYNLGSLTGTISDMGAIGSGSLSVLALAFQTYRDSTSAVIGPLLTGLSLNLRNLVYFDAQNPGNIRDVVTLSGMTPEQNMIAIDYSTNGMLYGLGYNSLNQTYQLYTIDSATGSVTAINTTPGSLSLGTDNGSGNYINAGFRFMATDTGKIRVLGNNGNTNVVLDAATGAIVETDTSLKYVTGDVNYGATANLTSVAFTGYGNDTTTQLFGFDANTGNMVTFDRNNSNLGYGSGSSGYINTGLSLNSILSFAMHTAAYNNSYMNIAYDVPSMSNLGFIAANYSGDSSGLLDYSILYNMSDMLTGYERRASTSPAEAGRIGYGTPVKDITLRRSAFTPVAEYVAQTFTASGDNDLLVYPNPVASTTHVVLPEVIQAQVYVYIIDLNGNVVGSYQYAPGSDILEVDMSLLPASIYSVRVTSKYIGDHNLKVVKE